MPSRRHRPSGPLLLAVLLALLQLGTAQAAGPSARAAYERAATQERDLRATPTPAEVRRVAAAYEAVAIRYENTGYADNALWRAGDLLATLYARTRAASDRERAVRRLRQLGAQYPTSSLAPAARARLATLSRAATRRDPTREAPPRGTTASPRGPDAPSATPAAPPLTAPAPSAVAGAVLARVTSVTRAVLPEVVRVTIELDREVAFVADRLEGPPRVFFDLRQAGAQPGLEDATLAYPDDVVRHIRVGKRPSDTTRVVLDLDGASRYSVFSLYDPFRIVVDVERPAPVAANAGTAPASLAPAPAPLLPARSPVDAARIDRPVPAIAPGGATPRPGSTAESRDATPASLAPAPAAPTAPAANANGGYSLARQLGLGVSRVVIDPGHGGHDPGAISGKVTEADLVLDIALRLEKLLLARPGIEVVLTRRTDTYVPLEERTAIANRERADLFLSIHANASRRKEARGIETYILNFASTPQAEAVAARENSASRRDMRHLPDIVRAIALNNKLDESRDFAHMVQRALVGSAGRQSDQRDLGVKQAPFVVLIGAQMPSILAEIAFITNPKDNQLLRTPAHRQRIAEALFDGVQQYQRSLKSVGTVANY
jgi:N-acetylmuramoyl-L-alanine amidase